MVLLMTTIDMQLGLPVPGHQDRIVLDLNPAIKVFGGFAKSVKAFCNRSLEEEPKLSAVSDNFTN